MIKWCAFCAVYEQGSYSAAAREVERSRTTVREHVMMLEDGVGEELFVIEGRNAVPTDVGHRLYPRAKILVRQLMEFRQEAQASFDEKLESLSIYYDSMIPLSLLSAIETHCSKAYPRMRVNWLLRGRAESINDLLEGKAHLALMPVKGKTHTEREVIFTNLGMIRCGVYCSSHSPLLEYNKLRITDLKLYKQYIHEDHFNTLRNQLQVSPQYHLVSSSDLLLSLLREDGWAMLPNDFAEPLCQQGQLSQLTVDEFVHSVNYNICTFHAPASEQHPVISDVLAYIKGYAKKQLS